MPDESAENKVSFIPFHAINEFMTSEYRIEIIRDVLFSINDLPEDQRNPIHKLTVRYVKIPGFRNSLKAPAQLRLRPTVDAFEKKPDLVAAILSAWAGLNAELGKLVYDLLLERGWEILPPDTDRRKIPGFLIVWPKSESFEEINRAFREKYPEVEVSDNDVALMTVWMSGRLPYQTSERTHHVHT